jgi:hypothetical protein
MFDPLRSTFTFSCPHGDDVRVPLSSLRTLDRLPGASRPPVYRVEFACRCGEAHPGLVSQTELDWGHLGSTVDLTFRNLMTSRDDTLAEELVDAAAARIGAGEWPWSFFCYLEGRPRPITPSAFSYIAPGGDLFGIAVECPACASVSVNLVTQRHVDVPFQNDGRVGVVAHVFEHDALRSTHEFGEELASARFDERRLDLR